MKCKNCGLPLDAFGICPKADPEDAAIMIAPVFCAPKAHPDSCGCQRCTATRELIGALA